MPQQMLNSNPDHTKVIDEYYNPLNLSEKAHLQDLVEDEMRAKGLDPINKEDIQKYWMSKGIQFNG